MLHCLKELIDCNARIWFMKISSFMFQIRDKITPCYEIFNDISRSLADDRKNRCIDSQVMFCVKDPLNRDDTWLSSSQPDH